MRLLYLDGGGHFKVTDDIQHSESYAILSHTWGNDQDEVTFEDIREGTGNDKIGWEKLRFIARHAQESNLKYFWVDTCCIHKKEVELATAIRSMFRWYAEAQICFVYLQDLSVGKRNREGNQLWKDKLTDCRWFRRGWTLQELLAPKDVHFYAGDTYLGTKSSLSELICNITGIDKAALMGRRLDSFAHHTRLRWASKRETKLAEDISYCLMGICGISMTCLYGEGGEQARQRLESKITKRFGTIALSTNEAPLITLEVSREMTMASLKFDKMDARKQGVKNALTRTCGWILSHPIFQAWLDPEQQHAFFWIKGKAGTGKSTLMKFIDSHISRIEKKGDDVCISFYFNARGEILEKGFIGLYRTLLMQLLLAVPALQAVLDGASPTLENSVEGLQNMFFNACLKLGKRRLFCFIDALDECRGDDVAQMIEFIEELCQAAADNNTRLLICLASRHYPIVTVPGPLSITLEDVNQHADDLEKFARDKLKAGIPRQINQILPELLRKANGIFLWMVIVVDILRDEIKDGKGHLLKRRLAEIPKGLDELFKSIIRRDRQGMDAFLLCLKWILCAQRPMQLAEYHFAMLCGIDGITYWNHDEISEAYMHSYLLSTSKGLAELSKGKFPTVQFIHESVRDYLVVKKGLAEIEQEQQSSEADIHEMLKKICYKGMNVVMSDNAANDDLMEPKRARDTLQALPRTELEKLFPFYDYATTYVLHHSNKAAMAVPQLDFLSNFDIDQWRVKFNSLQKPGDRQFEQALTLAYVCAERNLANLIKTLADLGHDVMADSNERDGTPIFAAIATKSTNSLQAILIATGATNVDEVIRELINGNHRGRGGYDRPKRKTRIQWAISRGYDNLATYLLSIAREVMTPSEQALVMADAAKHDCILTMSTMLMDIKSVCPYNALRRGLLSAAESGCLNAVQLLAAQGRSRSGADDILQAISAALQGGHDHIIESLLDLDTDDNTRVYDGALHHAAYTGHVELTKVLLDSASFGDRRAANLEALGIAVNHGHKELVELLLDKGFDDSLDIDAPVHFGRSALATACAIGQADLIRLLLHRGAGINAWVGDYGSPLIAASLSGHIGVVQLLLERGVDLHAYGATPLEAAATAGHLTIVRMLWDAGLNWNAIAKEFSKILLRASETMPQQAHADVVKWLLHKDVKASRHRKLYSAVLQHASWWGWIDIVRWLLANGADPNHPAHEDRGTALQAACFRAGTQKRNVMVVKALLAAGADVNEKDCGSHGPALHCACYRVGGFEVVELLISAGAEVNGTSGINGTALQRACYSGNVDIAKLLLGAGAEVDATLQDEYGNASNLVRILAQPKIARLLSEHSAH